MGQFVHEWKLKLANLIREEARFERYRNLFRDATLARSLWFAVEERLCS